MSGWRLTPMQKALLAEIAENSTLYIHRYGPYQRTVQALERRGHVYVERQDHSRLAMDAWAIVADSGETA